MTAVEPEIKQLPYLGIYACIGLVVGVFTSIMVLSPAEFYLIFGFYCGYYIYLYCIATAFLVFYSLRYLSKKHWLYIFAIPLSFISVSLYIRSPRTVVSTEHAWMWLYKTAHQADQENESGVSLKKVYSKSWAEGLCTDTLVLAAPDKIKEIKKLIAKENARFVDVEPLGGIYYSAIFCDMP